MRICFVGKYPPIEGGVSAQTYWAVRGLAERGHEVFVVTNAAEVEQDFRIKLEASDIALLAPSFPNGGAVRIFEPEQYGRRMSHIPMSNPFVSKLAGLAFRVVRGFDCEVVVGSYFEPYGLAASLAGAWAGTRVLLQHAGSDLDRLMRLPELAAAYQQALLAADGVITRPGLATRFLGLGVRAEALLMGPPYGMPALFTPDASPLCADDIQRLAFAPPAASRPDRAFDPRLPTIGMYGKPGQTKGTYDLIGALGTLRTAGLDFNLLLLNGSWQQGQVSAAIAKSGLTDRTWQLPFLPHWRVPSFIRTCTAVCFLERDFPIAIHGPVVAREVLSCGTCLVLSGEIHRKQRNAEQLVDGENIILVPDPKDREVLAKRLRGVIEQPANAAEIGARGRLSAIGSPGLDDFVGAWEELVTGERRSGLGRGSGSVADRLAMALPWARPLLASSFDELADEFGDADGSIAAGEIVDPVLADRFCDFAASRVADGIRDVARFERAQLWAMRDDDAEPRIPPVTDVLRNREPIAAVMRELYPFRRVPVRIERFDYDPIAAMGHADGAEESDVADIARQPAVICFARMPNLSPTEFRLNDATARLLERCSGATRADLLVAEIVAGFAPASDEEAATIDRQAFDALAGLHAADIVGFASAATRQGSGI